MCVKRVQKGQKKGVEGVDDGLFEKDQEIDRYMKI